MRLLILFTLMLPPVLLLSQIPKKKQLESADLKYYTVQLQVTSIVPYRNPQKNRLSLFSQYNTENATLLSKASGFFMKYKRRLFFVTNYHAATGRTWEDTSLFSYPSLTNEFDKMEVTFYSKKSNSYENIILPLHNKNGERTYYSIAADTLTKRTVIDIILMELDSLPGDSTVVYPIDLKKSASKWMLPPNTKLISYGYSKREWTDLYPYCDTIITVGDTSFSYKNQYVSVYNPPSMHGSSGSPVFYPHENKLEFVGVLFAVVPPEWREQYSDLFPRNYYTNPIGFIITANYLRESFEKILKGK